MESWSHNQFHRFRCLGATAALITAFGAGALVSGADKGDENLCACEIRSWVVFGAGRHLLADIDCPPQRDDLDGIVEFTTAALRDDYRPNADDPKMPRVARMTPGQRLAPIFADMQERTEASFLVTVEQAASLQRDRVFTEPYRLLGPNSNSGLRAALEACGLSLPAHVLESSGPLDEFPGAGMLPGDEIPRVEWARWDLGAQAGT